MSGTAQLSVGSYLIFFFQAEDGIRDLTVTGVQTCALPISSERQSVRRNYEERRRGRERAARQSRRRCSGHGARLDDRRMVGGGGADHRAEIGRASCRERV